MAAGVYTLKEYAQPALPALQRVLHAFCQSGGGVVPSIPAEAVKARCEKYNNKPTGRDTRVKDDTQTPDALLLRTAEGDRQAFAQLYKIASPRLFFVCQQILRREALAEEILQEGFIKIWNNAHRFDPQKAGAWTWMTSIVRNRALDLLRSLKSHPDAIETTYEGPDFASPSLGPQEQAELSADTQAILHCLEQLKDEQKHAILMAYYHGHTHAELSQQMGTPLGTVKAWIRRGMERLKQCLA